MKYKNIYVGARTSKFHNQSDEAGHVTKVLNNQSTVMECISSGMIKSKPVIMCLSFQLHRFVYTIWASNVVILDNGAK